MKSNKQAPTFNRVAFTTSRALEFFSESELTAQIGYRKELWPLVLIKELFDNSIDDCEKAARPIEIGFELGEDYIRITDNGSGIPHKVIKGVLDYEVRISDKKHYVAPTRGQLGNALKCVVAAPFVATQKKSVVEIETRGRRYQISVELNRLAQKPEINCEYTADAPGETGTILTVWWDEIASYFSGLFSELYQHDTLKEALEALIEDYAAFNPHVTFTFNKVRRAASDPNWSKWRTDAPTSAHWYRPEHLRSLVAAHICERDMPLRDFVGGFDGLARTKIRAGVLNDARLKGVHLSDLVNGNDVNLPSVTRLLGAMQSHSRPVQPKRLGVLGRDHLEQHFVSIGATKGFKYDRKTFLDDEGLPVVLETAFAIKDDHDAYSRRIVGLNWSPIFKIPSGAIGEAISSCHVNSRDPVVLLIHVARPRFDFTDHGKGALA